MQNNSGSSTTGLSASLNPTSETVTDKLPRGSALELSTIETLAKRIAERSSDAETKADAQEIEEISAKLLEGYMKQRGFTAA